MQTQWMLRLVGLAAALVMAAPAPAPADDSQTQTVFLSAPVEIPGTTLPAGSYVFETVTGPGSRHTVRIHSGDRSKLVTTAEAVPMKRNGALSDLVELRPTILGTAPTALQGWLRSGGDGYQFVYPAREAAAIANRTDTPVVASVADGGKDAQLVVIDAYGNRSPWNGTRAGL